MATPKRAALRNIEVQNLPKLGVSYTRYSTEEQGSTPEQQAINEELAAELDVTLVASFQDEGVSRSLSERPGLMEVFDHLEAHPEVRYLVVNELERLTAGIDQRQKIASLCKRLGVAILTEDMGLIDPHDDEKMHEADQRSVASQGEILKIRRRTRRSLRSRVRSGRSVIMRPAYGVRMVPLVTPEGVELPSGVSMIDSTGKRINSGAIELHPGEYPVLVRMFDWSAEGVGLGEIARRLNVEGIPTKSRKGRWSSSTVLGILRNPFYKGELIWGLQETRRGAGGEKYTVVRAKGDPGRIDMKSPLGAIIDPVTWELAAAKRDATAATFNYQERQRQARQVLDGRVYCARCGHKMYGRNNATKKYRDQGIINWAYCCQSMRPAFGERAGFNGNCTASHTVTLKSVLDELANFESPGAQISVVRGVSDSGVKEARRREREKIAKARAAVDRAEDFALSGDISKAKLRETKATQGAIIMEAEHRIETLGETREVAVEPIQEVQLDGFRELVELLRDERLPLSTRVAALDEFGLEKVYVDKPLLRLQLRD